MLINATRAGTGSMVPLDLLEVYIRYKQDTRAIIGWLLDHGTNGSTQRNRVSMLDLLNMSATIQSRHVVMPDTIDFHFRQAIAARTRLSNFFRKENDGKIDHCTVDHEFFTSSLTRIHDDLRCSWANQNEVRKQAKANTSLSETPKTAPNRFVTLEDCPEEEENVSCERITGHKSRDCEATTPKVTSTISSTPQLSDDHLSEAFEIHSQLQKIDQMNAAINTIWTRAARRETPVILAALMTHIALTAFEVIEQRLRDICDGDPAVLKQKYFQTQINVDAMENSVNEDCGARLSPIETLHQPWPLLLEAKKAHDKQLSKTDSPCKPKGIYQFTLRQILDASANEGCLEMFIKKLKHNISMISHSPNFVLRSSPLYTEMGYFLTHSFPSLTGNGLRLSYGVSLLMSSTKTYHLTPGLSMHGSATRLLALRFTQSAVSHVAAVLTEPTMPCRCRHTLAWHLEALHTALSGFLCTRAFDLYFQAPWISGSHIITMLSMLTHYGLRLFSYRHHVAAVVYTYHVLRLFMAPPACEGDENGVIFPEIPLLEALRETFADILFPGGLPERNFRPCWVRYQGGRLRFGSGDKHGGHHGTGAGSSPPKKKKQAGADHRTGAHHVHIPVSSARATAGYGLMYAPGCSDGEPADNDVRFDPLKASLTHHLVSKDYLIPGPVRLRLQDSIHKRERVRSNHQETASTASLLEPLHAHLLTTDFTGPFPRAKVNFFAIYRACASIAREISVRVHQPTDDDTKAGAKASWKSKGPAKDVAAAAAEDTRDDSDICLCFLDAILDAADNFVDNHHHHHHHHHRRRRRRRRRSCHQSKLDTDTQKRKEASKRDSRLGLDVEDELEGMTLRSDEEKSNDDDDDDKDNDTGKTSNKAGSDKQTDLDLDSHPFARSSPRIIKICIAVMRENLAGKGVEEFLWDGI